VIPTAEVADAHRRLHHALRGVLIPLYNPATHHRDGKLSSTVFARWREVWIHAVDLEVATPQDWPAAGTGPVAGRTPRRSGDAR